jgi:PAS domain S-box-containing protein
MANSIPQLAWMADETGYIFWYNQRWYDYTGTNLDEMKGWGWRKVHHPNHVNRVVQTIKHSFDTGKEWEDTFPMRSKDGEYRWFLSRAKPIRNQAGEIVRWFGTNTDVTENLQQKEALRRSEERLRLAKNSSRLGLFEYDILNNAIEWEPLLRELWGVGPDEPITLETFFAGLHPDDRQKTQQAIEKSTDPKGSGHYQVTYRVINKKTQAIYWIKASGTVLFDNKAPTRMIGLVDDITDQKKLELSLQEVVKQLQQVDENKNEFLSILGHELRNPLAALGGSVEVLQRKLPDEETICGFMQHSVNTMSKLLDDLLDLNRVSQNRIQLQTKIVDIGEVLNNVLRATETTYSKKDQHVTLHAAGKLQVIGDQTRLEQVFTNLVINACKYTPQGGKIALQADHLNGEIHIKVSDSGVGLANEAMDKIFEPFYQITQNDQAKQGLGIGLALSKKLVELHDGAITAHSEGQNKGSTFTVTLPAKAEIDTRADADKGYQPPQVKPGLKVLLIEDNEAILLTMPMVLEALECEVETAKTGQEGLDKVALFEPDVMLVDIGLPDISGHEVAEKARGNGFDGLMVAISGYSHTEMREKSLLVGFDYHLAKPAKLDELAAVLATALHRRE